MPAKPDESGVRAKIVETRWATEVADTSHAVIDAASALLANLEFLEDRSTGTDPARKATAADARESVTRLVELARRLQDAARTAARRAA